MNAAARELGLQAAEKAREAIRAKARQMRVEGGLPPAPALSPTLILTRSEMFSPA